MRATIGLAGALAAVLVALPGCAGGDRNGDATYAWCEVYPPAFDSGFAAASFTDPFVGTVVGGKTWVEQESGTDAPLYGVWLSDAMTTTVVGGFGTILRTTDGPRRQRRLSLMRTARTC